MLVDAYATHEFWSAALGDRSNQVLHFFKNLALVGGFPVLAAIAESAHR